MYAERIGFVVGLIQRVRLVDYPFKHNRLRSRAARHNKQEQVQHRANDDSEAVAANIIPFDTR